MSSHSPFKKFATGSFFLILDNLANYGIGAIFWIVLAKIVDPSSVGQSMTVIAFATSIVGFSGLGIQLMLQKYISEYNARNMPHTSRRLLKSAIKTSLIISGCVALVVTLIAGQLATVAYRDPSLAVLLIFIIFTYFPSQTVIAVLLGAFVGAHMAKYNALNDFIFQVSRIVIAVVIASHYASAFSILVSFSVSSLLALSISYFYSLPRTFPKLHGRDNEGREGMRQLIKFSGLSYLAIGLRTATAQIGVLVLATQNFEWAAFYGLAALISKVVGAFSISVSGALLPTVSEQLIKGDKVELTKMINTAIRISIFISGFGFTILMLDPTYFLKLISSAYIGGALALRILVIISINYAISSIFTSLLNASNRAADVARIEVISSVIIIVLTFVLIHAMGLEGAALAMFVGSMCTLILSLISLRKEEKISISIRTLLKSMLPIVIALVIGYVSINFWGLTLIGVIAAIVSYIASSLASRIITKNEIKELLHIVVSSTRTR
jgi:O-antigen/teichoic acid export membrane protein